jgi:queuine tRNA-ribosyltransferase
MSAALSFTITARDGAARRGLLRTRSGLVETPAFMPVATYGAVRGVSPRDLTELGAQILLANTFHLHERPGEETIARAGGLAGFCGWRGPWLTDSGGYQVTSLADRARVDEEGVAFASPLDGRRRLLTPERAIEIQEALGSDVAMVLDECVPAEGAEPARIEAAMERSLRWAERCARARRRADQAVFGIVQGGASAALRRRSATALCGLGFDGIAHGGLGLGEAAALRGELLHEVHAVLPAEPPRYLMGLGRPEDLVAGIAAGVDLFDCVIPTRHARHGILFTREGSLAIRNARFARDDAPAEAGCDCPTCTAHSRAYLRHLFQVNDALGPRLATLHNLRFYLRLLEEARAAIGRGCFAVLRAGTEAVARARVAEGPPGPP